ncbi:hypothetical protein BDZ94DRAFT_802797 [Collybia nuda]|uniref:Uncharacterized protein n=1 Tax=Collybia nuda TaxID=64659 RepID=A0A9P5Y1C0_9AGAR|nr:hypothetical protein BDZ94DRAFT_802797 [Collybia nuda]
MLWSLAHSSDDPAFAALLVTNTSKYFFSVTLALTLTCTLLVAYKLWSAQRKFQPVPSGYTGEYVFSRLSQIAMIIVESAAIYSSLLVALIVTDTLGIESFFIFFIIIPPIIGIIFSSIIVRTMKVNKQNRSGGTASSAVLFRPQRQETDEIAYTTTSGLSGDGLQFRLGAITQTESSIRGTEESKQKYDVHTVC